MAWHDDLVTATRDLIPTIAHQGLRKDDTAIKQARKKACNVLAKHPSLKSLLPKSVRWNLYKLSVGVPYNTEELLSKLIDGLLLVAQRTSIQCAVQLCDKLLKDSADHKLTGYQLTLFGGLKLCARWDITKGLYAIPYESLHQHLKIDEKGSIHDPIVSVLDQKNNKSITVLVSEMRWGPAIVPREGLNNPISEGTRWVAV